MRLFRNLFGGTQMKKLIPIGEVKKITGFGSSWIYKNIQDNEFPPPIKIGRSSRWVEEEVLDWNLERINKSRGEAA